MRHLVLENGSVHTMDRRRPIARSVTISGNLILSLDAQTNEDDSTRRIDLGGRCVIPGFTDSHVHFLTWALARRQLRLEHCRTYEEALDEIGRAARSNKRWGWLLGHGWRSLDWAPSTEPSRWDLDAVSGEVPVAMRSKDGHSLWLNSAALALADGDLATKGGVVETDEGGQPTGVLREEAAWRFERRLMRSTPEDCVDAMRAAIPVAHARGITSIHDKDGGKGALEAWQRLRHEDALTLRVWQSFPREWLPDVKRLGLRGRLGDDFLRIGYFKLFMDGSLGSQTAHRLDDSGVAITDRGELEHVIREASAMGWSVAVHAIGDLANREALDAFGSTRDVWFPQDLRPRIEHAQLIHPDDVGRFAELGVAASVQFSHAVSDRNLVDRIWGDVADHAYPFRSLLRSGALLANGSDAPIEELDPILGIRAAVCRTVDERPGWHREQKLTVQQALEASTVNPAWLSGDEARRGSLAPGMLADLVVLDRDVLECPEDELGEVQVVATMVGGRWVHGEPPWSEIADERAQPMRRGVPVESGLD